MGIQTITLNIEGMTCHSCEKIIGKNLIKLEGVERARVDYASSTAEIEYDSKKVSLNTIKRAIEEKGYSCKESPHKGHLSKRESHQDSSCKEEMPMNSGKNSWLYWIFAGVGLFVVIYFAWMIYGKFTVPSISQNMGYGLLFIVGLLTGFHCIGMCGGFVVSYTTKGSAEGKKPYQMHLRYAVGKTISYTVIGAIFGLVGSIIAFTPTIRGVAGILAGLFLILFGLKMLNIFPALRKFQLKMPKFMDKYVNTESQEHANNPLVIGLLNGLMIACGPLQAVYIMAAGTGSMIEGAKLLFIFGLGTLPVMLGFGYLTSIISRKATHKILKASGVIVIILGLIMLNRGLALTGTGYDFNTLTTNIGSLGNGIGSGLGSNPEIASTKSGVVFKDGYQEIRMDVTRSGWEPNKFILQKDVPVKWIINGKELNGCNSAIVVPKLGLNFDIKKGEQVIEFTPTEIGTISWSCRMGMITGVFVIQEKVDTAKANEDLNQVQVPQGSSCGMGGGGCGCGAMLS